MKPARPFAHLHVHSAFSLLDGVCRISELVEAVREQGMEAVALTDHHALYGAYEVYDAARLAGIKPVLGCEMGVRCDAATGPTPLVLLAESFQGFENLQRLVSLAHGRPGDPGLALDELAAHARHLLALSGSWPLAELPRLCAEGREEDAAQRAGALAEIFGRDAFFLELQNHGQPGQARANAGLRALGRRLGLSTVATQNAHYLRVEDAEAHRMLQCIRTGIPWRDRYRVGGSSSDLSLRGPAEMAEAFPEDAEALDRTVELAARCTCDLPDRRPVTFPLFPVPADFQPESPRFYPATEYLRYRALAGLRRRFGASGASPDRIVRLDAELEKIQQAGYVHALLVLDELAAAARQRRIPLGPGRGALVSSATAYALGLTGVDPASAGLVFERWINPDRAEAPDLGLEVPPNRRGELIALLCERYGPDRLAHLLTFNTFGPRQALRDVGRVLELAPERITAILQRLPYGAESLSAVSGAGSDETEELALHLARRIEGLPRNVGTHPSGITLSGGPLTDRVPVSRDDAGRLHVQMDHRHLNRAGLLKLDLHGPRLLQAIAEAQGSGEPFDPETAPADDPAVYDRLSGGALAGIGAAEFHEGLRRVQPRRLEDLAQALALYRPNPPADPADLLRRRADVSLARPPDPLLNEALADTSGLFLYEEQWIRSLAALTGWSEEAADRLLRVAVAHPLEARHERQLFLSGLRRVHRIREPRAARLFEIFLEAARRVTSKATVMASAHLLYQAAWLHVRRPREFLAARIAAEPGAGPRLSALLGEARTAGLEVLPPDINRSAPGFRPEGSRLRFGLSAIRHIGPETAQAVVEERERNGPYTGLAEFCRRQSAHGLSHRILDTLIRCGAMDVFQRPRADMAAELEPLLESASALRRDLDAGQRLLFQPLEILGENRPTPGKGNDWPEERKRADERELLGMEFF